MSAQIYYLGQLSITANKQPKVKTICSSADTHKLRVLKARLERKGATNLSLLVTTFPSTRELVGNRVWETLQTSVNN